MSVEWLIVFVFVVCVLFFGGFICCCVSVIVVWWVVCVFGVWVGGGGGSVGRGWLFFVVLEFLDGDGCSGRGWLGGLEFCGVVFFGCGVIGELYLGLEVECYCLF